MISASPLKDYLKKQAKLILEMNNLHYSRDRVFTENDTIDRINEQFIKKSTGILHIGGHKGQEAFNYAQHKKQAIFIEAVPEFFEILQSHLKQFPKQQAVCALLGDHNLDSIQFHLASND